MEGVRERKRGMEDKGVLSEDDGSNEGATDLGLGLEVVGTVVRDLLH